MEAPGRYKVSVPPIEGFEPVPPFEIEIRRGEITPCEIKLQRRL
jgi:hypothetical protein